MVTLNSDLKSTSSLSFFRARLVMGGKKSLISQQQLVMPQLKHGNPEHFELLISNQIIQNTLLLFYSNSILNGHLTSLHLIKFRIFIKI